MLGAGLPGVQRLVKRNCVRRPSGGRDLDWRRSASASDHDDRHLRRLHDGLPVTNQLALDRNFRVTPLSRRNMLRECRFSLISALALPRDTASVRELSPHRTLGLQAIGGGVDIATHHSDAVCER